jgi:NADPH:quinone reductase-like Zn-dependent oxidoreductase
MKAIVYRRYGSPDVLQYEDIDKPTVGDDQVLIKVRAASVNPYDCHFMRGTPYFMRLMTGLRKPKVTRLGVDVAGHVEAVGRNVTQIKPGDELFGSCRGAFAEYVCAPESALAMKPDNVTFEQAASVPVAALTALQGLRDKGRIQAGQKVLINGAAGGVGTFAVQIAKSFGADVTGVCSTRNVDMVRSIGADHVVDYTREDFTRSGHLYDLILDCIGNHSFFACRRVLNSRGIFLAVGGASGRWMIGTLARLITVLVLSRFVSQTFVVVMAKGSKEDLTIMHDLMKAGKVTPVIDKCYRLSEVPEAVRYLEQGHARGKVVITVEGDRNGEATPSYSGLTYRSISTAKPERS